MLHRLQLHRLKLHRLKLHRLRRRVLREGMKLLSVPQVAQLMADPRLMAAVMRGLEAKGYVQSTVEGRFRAFAATLGLATRSDIDNATYALRHELQRYVHDLESRYDRLNHCVESTAMSAAAASPEGEARHGQSSG